MDSLDRLSELTDRLPRLATIIGGVVNGMMEVKTENGTLLVSELYHGKGTRILRCFASAGSVMVCHVHKEREIVSVESGGPVTFEFEDDPEHPAIMSEFEAMIIEPGRGHRVRYDSDTWTIAQLLPAGEELCHGNTA